jgi:hypothetical protein
VIYSSISSLSIQYVVFRLKPTQGGGMLKVFLIGGFIVIAAGFGYMVYNYLVGRYPFYPGLPILVFGVLLVCLFHDVQKKI